MESSSLELIIRAREKDLGGFAVRRVLPFASHRMVGPFIFFDHMGPAEFPPGHGMDVRPHPHINLATVTYLFEGKIQHRDSLGSDQLIEPGAINWMTAGRGIVHSERTPDYERKHGFKINGIQLWVALPQEFEEVPPSFSHHPKSSLPEFQFGDAKVKLLLGVAFNQESPVPVHSDLFYADVRIPKGKSVTLSCQGREAALYVVEGTVEINGESVSQSEMAVGKIGTDFSVFAKDETRLMFLGGSPLGERFMFWNFVSSSKERLEEAKQLWLRGPSKENSRFWPVQGDDQEFIPLPK
jgi:redox-sensitive bicupin YhaK (pirin superfamily)